MEPREGGAGRLPGSRATPTNLLLTGAPGIGKTTVIQSVAERVDKHALGGFVTEEIRVRGRRVGFRLLTFGREQATLAHVEHPAETRVGRYGVDLAALDRIVDASLNVEHGPQLFLVDEIGKMECLSQRFVSAITGLLDDERLVVATVSFRGGGFIAEVKRRPDVLIWELSLKNRAAMPERVLAWIKRSSAHHPR
ncbi:MAG: AAA family ATPase [Acidobacteriota bacterium]|nr:MAG: AAA family ATPase [Acidobacteriota bacterium]